MNPTNRSSAESFDRLVKLLIFLFLVLPIVVLSFSTNRHVASIEENLHYREPSSRDDARREIEALPWHPVQGQTLYVPAYSHIYQNDGEPRLLTVTLSARNTDRQSEIVLTSVDYHDTSGKLLRAFLDKPLRLGPLASTEFLIKQKDKSGGSGASFLVHWQAGVPVTPPVVESVMIDTSNQQGISFARPASVLDEDVRP